MHCSYQINLRENRDTWRCSLQFGHDATHLKSEGSKFETVQLGGFLLTFEHLQIHKEIDQKTLNAVTFIWLYYAMCTTYNTRSCKLKAEKSKSQ